MRAAERWPERIGSLPMMLDAIAFCGGLLIVALGVSLLQSAAAVANHPLL